MTDNTVTTHPLKQDKADDKKKEDQFIIKTGTGSLLIGDAADIFEHFSKYFHANPGAKFDDWIETDNSIFKPAVNVYCFGFPAAATIGNNTRIIAKKDVHHNYSTFTIDTIKAD